MIGWIALIAFAFVGYRVLGAAGALLGAVLGSVGYKVGRLIWLRSQFKKRPQDFPEFLGSPDPTRHLREQAPPVVRRKILVRVDFFGIRLRGLDERDALGPVGLALFRAQRGRTASERSTRTRN